MFPLFERIRDRPLASAVGALVLVAIVAAVIALARTDDGEPAGTIIVTPSSTEVVATTTTPGTPAPTTTAAPVEPVEPGKPTRACLVWLHGKSDTGGITTIESSFTVLRPTGNAEGWGGRQWLYYPAAEYEAARAVVADAIAGEGCTAVALHGFSNGGAFAGKLVCQGETFGGRLVGAVIDDPVPDRAVEGCARPDTVDVTIYWTGGLAGQARPGWACIEADWTCEGGTTIGIDAYAAALGAPVTASPHSDHEAYVGAPDPFRWLATPR